jgi:hypothetical protein
MFVVVVNSLSAFDQWIRDKLAGTWLLAVDLFTGKFIGYPVGVTALLVV